jgi:hypothetical protein
MILDDNSRTKIKGQKAKVKSDVKRLGTRFQCQVQGVRRRPLAFAFALGLALGLGLGLLPLAFALDL